MTELLPQLLAWIPAHPLGAGLAIFLVAMSESLAVIGLLVPGVLMMFGIGALVAAGAVEFSDAYAWAVAGAVAGDGLSFWLGRRFRDRIRGLWPFSRHPTGLERGLGFFDRYGGKSVVFGRFVGPVRAIIPLVAGMLGMSPRRFLAANLLSALAWAPAYLLPGMLFGASLELASEVAFRLVILLLLLAVILWTVVWTVRTAFRVLHPHASAWLQAVLGWSALHPKFGEIGRALADPSHPEARGLALFASLLTVSAGLLMLLTGVLLGGGWPSPLDHTLFEGLRSLRNPLADHFMVYASRLADTFVVVPLIVGVLLYLAAQRHWRTTAYWLAAAAFGMLSSVVLKYSLRIPRPLSGIEGLTPFAFPSTHGMRATVLYGFLAVMIARALRARWRWIPYSIAGVIMAIVSMSRVYLGVQWLSERPGEPDSRPHLDRGPRRRLSPPHPGGDPLAGSGRRVRSGADPSHLPPELACPGSRHRPLHAPTTEPHRPRERLVEPGLGNPALRAGGHPGAGHPPAQPPIRGSVASAERAPGGRGLEAAVAAGLARSPDPALAEPAAPAAAAAAPGPQGSS